MIRFSLQILVLLNVVSLPVQAANVADDFSCFVLMDLLVDDNLNNKQDIEDAHPLTFAGGARSDNGLGMAWRARDILSGTSLSRNETLRQIFADLIILQKQPDELLGNAFEVIYSDEDVLFYRRGWRVLVAISRSENDVELELGTLPFEAVWNLTFSSVGNLVGELNILPARSAQIFVNAYQTYGE